MSLATKYRPKTFDEVVEQNVVKAILQNQIKDNDIKNCYLFCGPAGTGKAQPLDSLILTPSGYIRMGDVKVGTEIFTRLGEKAKVSAVFPQGIRRVFRITFNDRTSILVADNHLNSVYRYNQDHKRREDFVVETTELIELQKTSRFSLRVDVPVIKFEKKEVPVDPYLLGFLIGDGSLHGNFSFSTSENDLIEKIDSIVRRYNCHVKHISKYDYGIVKNSDPYKYVVIFDDERYCGIEKVIKKLESIGYPKFDSETIINIAEDKAPQIKKLYPELFGRFSVTYNDNYEMKNNLLCIFKNLGMCVKSTDKFIPKEYLFNDFETRLAVFQGLFDSDGTIHDGETSFSTSSKQLSDDFAFLVRSLGCRDTVTQKESGYNDKNGNFVKCNDSYTHFIKIPNNLQFCTSKKHLSKRTIRQTEPIRKIVSIDYVGEMKCQCIYVDNEDHTYITDNFTPTHNTTTARLFANDLNSYITELDAASHNGVDDIRQLIEESRHKPIGCAYRVYIIDEAHCLSGSAWSAFLKCLEEPTPTSIFIFATTDPQKIPKTIISRIQRFELKKISFEGIVNRLKFIIDSENKEGANYTFDEDAISYIARLSDGGMRDAITSMEKALSFNSHLSIESVTDALGTVDYNTMFDLTDAVVKMNKLRVIEIIETINNAGCDLKQFTKNYCDFVLDLCKYDIVKTFDYILIPPTFKNRFTSYNKDDYKFFTSLLNEMINLNTSIKWESMPKPLIESTLLLLCSEV